MAGENIAQTIAKVITLSHRVDENIADLKQHKTDTNATLMRHEDRIRALSDQISDMKERLARLETARNADRAELQAEAARFRADVERAETRLSRLLPSKKSDETERDES